MECDRRGKPTVNIVESQGTKRKLRVSMKKLIMIEIDRVFNVSVNRDVNGLWCDEMERVRKRFTSLERLSV